MERGQRGERPYFRRRTYSREDKSNTRGQRLLVSRRIRPPSMGGGKNPATIRSCGAGSRICQVRRATARCVACWRSIDGLASDGALDRRSAHAQAFLVAHILEMGVSGPAGGELIPARARPSRPGAVPAGQRLPLDTYARSTTTNSQPHPAHASPLAPTQILINNSNHAPAPTDQCTTQLSIDARECARMTKPNESPKPLQYSPALARNRQGSEVPDLQK
jgi:hypothetical protein